MKSKVEDMKDDVEETDFGGKVNESYVEDKKVEESQIVNETDAKDKASKEKKQSEKSVSTRELFRFCGKRERMLIIIGTIGAIIHGAAFPTMIIFYGSMTESFVQWNICDEMTGQVRCHTNPDVFQYTNCSETIEPERVTCLNQYCSDKVKTFDAKMEIDDEDVPVFRTGCQYTEWYNWVTTCNSCGKEPNADSSDVYISKHANCEKTLDFLTASDDVVQIDEAKFGIIACPNIVGANLQRVGKLFYGDDFCSEYSDPNECTAKDVLTVDKDGSFDVIDEEFSVYTSLAAVCIVFAIIATLTVIAGYFQVMMYTKVATYQVHLLRQLFFKSIMGQEIGWFDVNAAGTLNSMLADDVTKVSDGMGDKFAILLQKVACFIFGIIFALIQGWQLALVIMCVLPLIVGGAGFLSRAVSQMSSKELLAYGKAGAVAEEVLNAIRTVNSFHGQDHETERYDMNLGEAQRQGIRKGMVNGLFLGYSWCIIFISFAISFGVGALIFDYSADKITAVFYSVLMGALQLSQSAPNIEAIGVAKAAAYNVFEIIDRVSKIDPFSKDGIQISEKEFKGDIELKNVSFAYPSRPDEYVVKNLSIKFKAGQTSAIVGPSGMGKSTVVQLIERFYDPQVGEVLIDGINVKKLNIAWWRNMIGVVEQEPSLFNTSIYENIKYGKPDATREEIIEAAKDANAFNFIMELPQNFETNVGDRGNQLSGGQKQRVAVARALIRKPKILLFDQATSALDNESESIVIGGLKAYKDKGCTTILIAHRLSTIKAADVINGMEHGKVVESGSHDELMAQTGVYFSLVTLQATDKKKPSPTEAEVAKAKEAKLEREGSIASRKSIAKRNSKIRASSRLSRISHPMSLNDTSNAIKDAYADEIDEYDEENLPATSTTRIIKLNASEWPQLLFGSLAAFINGSVLPICAWIISYILGYLGEPDQTTKRDGILRACIVFILIAVIQLGTQFLQGYLFGISGERLTRKMRKQGFHAILRQDIAFFDDSRNNTSALATKLQSDAGMVQAAAGGQLGIIFSCIATVVISLTIAFSNYWQLALLVLCFFPLTAFTGVVQGKIWSGQALTDGDALEEAGKMVSEAVEMIRTVAAFNREQMFDGRYNEEILPPRELGLKRSHTYGLMYGVSQSILFYAFSATFIYGGFLVQNHAITYERVFRIFSAVIFGGTQIGRAAASAPDFSKAKDSAARIFRLLDREPAYADPYATKGEKWDNFKGDITFNNLQFTYPTRKDIQVLNKLAVSIKAGQTLALVGQSGCGKSTCMQLLQRYYDTDGGAVLVDGHDTTKTNTEFLRSHIGIVAQEPTLFDATIGENIKYGCLSRTITDEEMITASKIASLHDFIKDMPLGYDTPAGGGGGNQMSRGQKQRVAIARAIVRNPKILLLDEATSALDTESEKIVQAALDRAREGRTCIVIAHRLSTIRSADKIAVLNKGMLLEAGTHDELMALEGAYHKLITMNVTLS